MWPICTKHLQLLTIRVIHWCLQCPNCDRGNNGRQRPCDRVLGIVGRQSCACCGRTKCQYARGTIKSTERALWNITFLWHLSHSYRTSVKIVTIWNHCNYHIVMHELNGKYTKITTVQNYFRNFCDVCVKKRKYELQGQPWLHWCPRRDFRLEPQKCNNRASTAKNEFTPK